ncbi:MAG: DUF2480 family protein [Saprospiraceae bacterium]|nr:DUF2480 family protein [Saprospiraceae bacterium]
MEKELINRIANSPLITLDMEPYAPKWNYKIFDIKDYLFQGLLLREKDFRQSLKDFDWSVFKDMDLLVFCSNDAIIPMWAYMLITISASPFTANIYHKSEQDYRSEKWTEAINAIDLSPYENKKMIIKGCSNNPIPPSAYATITARLLPIASSIMFGEPCSTVPVYKKPVA